MIEPQIEYYSNGNKQCESYRLNDYFHNPNGPAIIWYYKNGNVESEYYYLNSRFHNENGPSIIYYNEKGNKKSEHYHLNGVLNKYIKYTKAGKVSYTEYFYKDKKFTSKKKMNQYIKLINIS